MFEVWVENKKLFGNLSLAHALASFLHLAFVFDLKYPKVSSLCYYICLFLTVRRGIKYALDLSIIETPPY